MRKLLLAVIISGLLFSNHIWAQSITPGGGGGGGGGSGSPGGTNGQIQFNNSGTFGGLTPAIGTGCGASGGTIGNSLSGTIATAESTNAQTGPGYTTQATDCGKLVTLSNASTQILTLNNLSANQFFDVLNIGAGTWTISAGTGSIIGGPTSLTQNQGAHIVYDGTNWHVQAGAGSGSAPTQTITAGTNITTSGTCSGTALSCTVNASGGGGTSNGVVSIPQSNYWMTLQPGLAATAGPSLTASTQFCYVGSVSTSTVIKNLGASIITPQTSAAVEFGLYSIANSAGVTTWTVVDHTGSVAATAGGDAIGALGNTTDTLSPGTLYGLCLQTNTVANVVLQSIQSSNMNLATIIGSKTLANSNRLANNLTGFSKSGITFGTWSTQTLNSGTGDMSELDGPPIISFEVN